MIKKYYFYIVYDAYLCEDETFTSITYKGSYLSVPNKIINAHSRENKDMVVHEQIFNDILSKSSESHNNLCSIYI